MPAHDDFSSSSSTETPVAHLALAPDDLGGLVLSGEIDAATAWSLARLLDDPDVVRLDCSEITFFGAAGLHVLLAASRVRRLTLHAPSDAVARVLAIAGLTGEFDIEPPAHQRSATV